MYTIQFETDANGRLIEIPQEYEMLASKHLKVIIMLDDSEQTNKPNRLKKAIKQVSAMTINTLSHKFDREEAKENENFFNELRNRHIHIEKKINIDEIMQDMNDGLR